MTLLERLPQLEDTALTNLWRNALRLIDQGPADKRESAAGLLPAIEQEIAVRKVRHKEDLARRAAVRREARRLGPGVSRAPPARKSVGAR